MSDKACVHYYYGYGKGKTTAALGLLLRAVGWGKSAVMVQFLKNSDSGELHSLEHMQNVKVLRGHAGGFANTMTPEQLAESREIHNRNLTSAIELASAKDCGLLVMDEVGDALMLGLVDWELVQQAIACAERGVEVVMTGHQHDERLSELCDYVTQMKKEKHPYDAGKPARRGVEF